MLAQALSPVADDLKRLDLLLPSLLPTETKTGRAVIDHVFGAGGKRIRPALYYLAAQVIGYDGPYLDQIAAVTEYVHTASLLHDDVVDNSTVRRGKPTSNSIYGDVASVLVGDLIYSTASEIMAKTGNMEIVKTFARAIRLMSDGELLQLENLFNPHMKRSTYLRILECKTAILIEAATKSPALLSGANSQEIASLAQFGHSVGMAFQLIDDALDYTGDSNIIGKSTKADLLEGKVTLPVILLKDLATDDEKSELQHIISGHVTEASLKFVSGLVEKYDTAQKTVDQAEVYTQQAMKALDTFPKTPERDTLENLAHRLLLRFN